MFYLQIGNEGLVVDLIDDFDIEEVFKEFDFLVIVEDGEGVGEVRSLGDGIEWGKVIRNMGVGEYLVFKYVLLLNIICRMCVFECMVVVKLRGGKRY